MSSFAESYLGQLRAVVGTRELLTPGARVLVENVKGELLMELKSEKANWGFPGGCAELAERIDDVAKREVLEETGLALSHLIPFGYASDPLHERGAYANGDAYHCHAMLFVTNYYSGTLRPQDGENIALAWFHPDRLPERIQKYVPRTIAAYRRFLATGDFQLC